MNFVMFNTTNKPKKAYFNANTKLDKFVDFIFFKIQPGEIWKSTKYENYYVSSYGRIASTCRKRLIILKPYRLKGYEYIDIKGTNIAVHRLVAETFMPNPDKEKMEVHHKDRNILNNHLDNLEWISSKDHHRLHSRRNRKTNAREVKKNG